MGIFQNRLENIKSKKITFDNLTVLIMAVVCVGFVVNGRVPEEIRVAEATVGGESLGELNGQGNVGLTVSTVSLEDNLELEEVLEGELEDTVETQSTSQHGLALTGLEEYQYQFINKIAPVAIEVAKEYNVYPSIIVAQAILESDWGRSPLAVNANNLFGIKGSYKGEWVNHETKEDDGTGHQYTITDKFAKYPTYTESVESNAKLIRNGVSFDAEYYAGAWVENTKNYQEATLALTGTYATDINYNTKVNGVIADYNLDVLDK